MPFRPSPATVLTIDGLEYRVCEHPSAPGRPYGHIGREAAVYKLTSGDRAHALKVFNRSFRGADTAAVAARLRLVADVPGLAVAQRTVLEPRTHGALIAQHPDLAHAVLMPWVDGPTWFDMLLNRVAFSPGQSRSYARELVTILFALEERRCAHSDLSPANLVLAGLTDAGRGSLVELIDVDQFLMPGMAEPAAAPPATPGYAMKNGADARWSQAKDRFAGAVLLAELLTWSVQEVREAARKESYFDPAEMQQDCDRYQLIQKSLANVAGSRAADLFARAWFSGSLDGCPSFQEWQAALPAASTVRPDPEAEARALIKVVRGLLDLGEVAGARRTLDEARLRVAPGSGLTAEIDSLLQATRVDRVRVEAEQAAAYGAGVDHLNRGRLQEAKAAFLKVESLGRGYRDTQTLLQTVERRLREPRPSGPVTAPASASPGVRLQLAIGLGIGVALVIALIGAGVYASTHNGSTPSATATETPAPPPDSPPSSTPLPGNMVFFDDFSTDKSWDAYSTGGFVVTLKQGALHASVTKLDSAFRESYPRPPIYLSVRIDVVMTRTAGAGGYGVKCGTTGASGYSFWIDTEGYADINLDEDISKPATVLRHVTMSGWDASRPHTLSATCAGSPGGTNLTFVVDGRTILTASDATYTGGFKPAFVVQSSKQSTMDVDVSRFTVTSPP